MVANIQISVSTLPKRRPSNQRRLPDSFPEPFSSFPFSSLSDQSPEVSAKGADDGDGGGVVGCSLSLSEMHKIDFTVMKSR